MLKICQHCDKEVTAEGRNKFCSAECQSAFYEKEKRKAYFKRYYQANKEELKDKAKECRKKIAKDGKIVKSVVCVCGKEFLCVGSVRNAIYCSKECFRETYRAKNRARFKRKEPIIKNCKECGVEIVCSGTGGYNKLYCSDKCHRDATRKLEYERYKRLEIKIKTCKHCGKEFMNNYYRGIYCSDECRKKDFLFMKENNIKVEHTKNCSICGKEFTTNIYWQTFCSKECKKINKSIKRRKFDKI